MFPQQKGSSLLKLSTIDEGRENGLQGWGNLDTDVLVRIFKKCYRLPELKTCGLTLVCRGWRAAFKDPMLWKTIDLSHMKSNFIKIQVVPFVYVERRSDEELTKILNFCLRLSKGNTSTVIFHYNLFPNADMITNIAEGCPDLRRLVLPSWTRIKQTTLCNAISCFKNLESLTMPSMIDPQRVFSSIQKNCKKLRELKVMGTIELDFVKNLVQLLPEVKVLSLRCTGIYEDALVKILDEMTNLEVLNISHCYILVPEETEPEYSWSEIMEKASKLKRVVTCNDPETCVICRKAHEDEGMLRWYKCEEGLWKADEVTSLHL